MSAQASAGATATILRLAQHLAAQTPGFFEIKGAGHGDRATNVFMMRLREYARLQLGTDYSEKRICGDAGFAVDFYVPEEGTVIEIALSLRNPQSEFERDLFKALIARDQGLRVEHLVLVSKPGAAKRIGQPGSRMICAWAKRNFGIRVQVYELLPPIAAEPPVAGDAGPGIPSGAESSTARRP